MRQIFLKEILVSCFCDSIFYKFGLAVLAPKAIFDTRLFPVTGDQGH